MKDEYQDALSVPIIDGLKALGFDMACCEHRSLFSIKLPGGVAMIPAGERVVTLRVIDGVVRHRGRPMPKAAEFENSAALASWLIRDR